MATKKEKALRESLESQLRDQGADVLHFQTLLDDYIFFYTQAKKMQADVKKNGPTITAKSAAGKEYDKENPAIKAAVMYNKQQLAILKEMGLTTETCHKPSEDDEDL